MDQLGRGNRGCGYGDRGSGGRYSGGGDCGGRGSGWQQGGHGDRGCQGDGGRGGGRQGDQGMRRAYGGRCGGAGLHVSLAAGHGVGQPSGARQDGHGHRGWEGDGGWGDGRHGDQRGQGAYGGRGAVQQVSPAAGRGGGQPSGAPGSVANVWNTARDRLSAWGRGGGAGAWGKPMAASTAVNTEATTPDSLASGLGRMVISPATPPARCLPSLGANKILPLRVNNFSLRFDDKMIVYHYDVDVKPENLPTGSAAPEISKSDLSAVQKELFRAYAAQFPVRTAAFDGQRNLFSPGWLPEECFRVVVWG